MAHHPIYRTVAERFTTAALLDLLIIANTREVRAVLEKMLLEHVFELARRETHPGLPSRLSSVFLFLERQSAELFRSELNPDRVIYRCTVRGWWFRGESNKIYDAGRIMRTAALTKLGLSQALERMRQVALSYWGHEFNDATWPEVLLDGEALLLEVDQEPTSVEPPVR